MQDGPQRRGGPGGGEVVFGAAEELQVVPREVDAIAGGVLAVPEVEVCTMLIEHKLSHGVSLRRRL